MSIMSIFYRPRRQSKFGLIVGLICLVILFFGLPHNDLSCDGQYCNYYKQTGYFFAPKHTIRKIYQRDIIRYEIESEYVSHSSKNHTTHHYHYYVRIYMNDGSSIKMDQHFTSREDAERYGYLITHGGIVKSDFGTIIDDVLN